MVFSLKFEIKKSAPPDPRYCSHALVCLIRAQTGDI